MARCPLCSSRTAKRRCPAKRTEICPVCCATKREVEIDCPSDCVYLRQGQSFAVETAREAAPTPSRTFSAQFRRKNVVFITALAEAIGAHRATNPSLLDSDVRDAFTALKATARTLDSGIYYETLPEGGASLSLYRRVRSLLDQLIQPQSSGYAALRVADAADVCDFVIVSVDLHSGGRPKSRRFLDWLSSSLPEADVGPGAESGKEGSGLFLP